ncbi:MAG: GNAT family N-acetyltransferase [Gammaproteobacteria bacterium]|jgi:ribosomal protein S18 acetylase RimI-like enzyme|nr:GNAT family N-acetyltransferase [Gammaproteobacteria bacterium]
MENIEPVNSEILIRDAIFDDLEAIGNIDAQISGARKPDYWNETFEFYSTHKENDFFFVAMNGDEVVGFIVGEIRAWEFGSSPCGWVFAIGIKVDQRLHKVGTSLLETLCERFKQAGVEKVRTMVNRADREIMAFFRSQGLMAGPYQELEKDLI